MLPLPTDPELAPQSLWIGGAVIRIPSIVFAVLLPRLKVGFMATAWRLPKNTLVCSRPLLRLVGSGMVGKLIGNSLLSLLVVVPHLPAAAIILPTTIAFFFSAHQRLQKHLNLQCRWTYSILLGYRCGGPDFGGRSGYNNGVHQTSLVSVF